jgi:hypothetical protein
MQPRRLFPCLVCAPLSLPAAALADTAFNSFHPTTQDYSSNIIFPLGQLWTQGDLAWPFTAVASGPVTQLRIAAYTTAAVGSPPATILFSIYADSNGQPGALIGQWTGGAPAIGGAAQHPAPWTVDVSAGPLLETGHSYFFGMGLPAFAPGWFGSSPTNSGLPTVVPWRLAAGSWTPVPPAGTYPAIDLTVPAPSSAVLLALPLMATRRRRGARPVSR